MTTLGTPKGRNTCLIIMRATFAPVRDRKADADAVRARRAATSGQVNAAKLRAFDLIRAA